MTTEKIELYPLKCATYKATLMVNPNVAYSRRGRTRQSASDVGGRRLGQDEQYLTYVRSCPGRARLQMVRYHASTAIFTGLGMQR